MLKNITFSDKKELLEEMENLREKLNKNHDKLSEDEVVKLSQKLDRLIFQIMKEEYK